MLQGTLTGNHWNLRFLLLAVLVIRMSASDDIMRILRHIWTRLQGLSQDHPLMQVAFLVILLFFLTFIALVIIGCVYGRCGCCKGTRNKVSSI
ncbi:small integral membrane protein 5 [Myxocyprinus asiaticus]|uniref:small integral membrane protein 5 n=1 Tax=Myxocyprinus asiaticus TaxID=70543 RepID=UPI0022227CC6|nr:small integral membrane protein 5 [Myxocyprinus asiaticus]